MKIAVIIAAAGSSRRFTHGLSAEGEPPDDLVANRSKLDEDLGGRPVIQRTVELFVKHPDVSFMVVAGPADPQAMTYFRQRHGDKLGMLGAVLCEGGRDHRYQTVQNALARVPDTCTHVAVHDGARPCTSPALIERLFAAAGDHNAVVPGIDVPDTLKRVRADAVVEEAPDPLAAILGAPPKGGGELRLVEQTIDRARVVAVQTPQVFALDLLRRAYGQKDLASTDDAQLVERLGEKVIVVPGEPTNIKITRPADVRLARAILGFRGPEQRAAHKRF